MSLSVADFVSRWKLSSLSERSASQSHFIDLCNVLGEPHPAAADSIGERFTFEKVVPKAASTSKGFADVWLRDHFAWEYKGKHKDLARAYKQINDYREELGNPPLLVVSDMDRFEVHTNFTSTRKRVYSFTLDDLARNRVTSTCPLPPLDVLRALFQDTNALRPDRTDARVTQQAAKVFSRLAERLEIEKRALTDSPLYTREQIAHFLMRLLFCLFADSIGLLPNHLFRSLLHSDDRFLPKKFLRKLRLLFQAMSEPDGIFGEHSIRYFSGGLFDSDSIIELDVADLGILYEVSRDYNWAHVAPEIFGTLFERSRHSLIGAHYTAAEDILLLIEPVVMRPLLQQWALVRDSTLVDLGLSPEPVIPTAVAGEAERPASPASAQPTPPVISTGGAARRSGETPVFAPAQPLEATTPTPATTLPLVVIPKGSASPPGASTPQRHLRTSRSRPEDRLAAFLDTLAATRILDPACGSGNFLYLALRRLLDLWHEVHTFAVTHNLPLAASYDRDHVPSPAQLFGIEIEFYAHEL